MRGVFADGLVLFSSRKMLEMCHFFCNGKLFDCESINRNSKPNLAFHEKSPNHMFLFIGLYVACENLIIS